MSHLDITERRNDSIIILDLSGRIIFGEGCTELRKALRRLADSGEKKILLNLADVSYVDSSGLGTLVGGYTTFKKNAGEMKLIHLSERVHELMTLTKLLTIFDVFDNEAEAIERFDNPLYTKSAYVSRLV